MQHTRRVFDCSIPYESFGLFTLYYLATLAKIYYQINFSPFCQVIFLIISNYLLIYPFLKDYISTIKVRAFQYFILINLGEIFIIYHNNALFFKMAILFYLFSKLTLILVFKNLIKDYKLSSMPDLFKIIIPQLASFFLSYLIYNNANLDLVLTILVIIYSVIQALIFSYIFYFQDIPGIKFIQIGIMCLSTHDIFGGYNFFNENIDSNFVVSFLFISVGNFFLGYGIWKTRFITT